VGWCQDQAAPGITTAFISSEQPPSQPGEKPPPNEPFSKENAAKYHKQVKEELNHLQRDLAILKERAKEGSAELRAKLQPTINALEKQSKEARKHLSRLEKQTGQAWQAARPGLERAMGNLRDAFKKAADQFRK
jgi:hypothetical protein